MQKFKHTITISIFVLITNISLAQIFSPYSQYGLGLLQNNHSAITGAMGGINAAFADQYNINYLNPAALSKIKLTTFDIGARIDGRSIAIADATPFSVANGGVNNVSLAFPVMKNRWGMAFGLLPYSFSKYKYVSNNTFNNINYKTFYEGKGSLYKLFLSNGVSWKVLSAGVKAEFIFGKLENSIYKEFSENDNGSRLVKKVSLKDVVFNIGAQYNVILTKYENREKNKENLEMTVGAYFEPSLKVDALTSNYLEVTKIGTYSKKPYAADTAQGGIFDNYTTVSTPLNTGFGVNVGRNNKWNIGIDYDFKSWAKTKNPISKNNLTDEWNIKLGGSITPNNKSTKLLNRITYRLGSHFGKAPVIHENTGVSDFGITFGFGIPFARHKYSNRSLSNLNLAFEIGALGINKNQSLVENYYNFTLTYTLSALWFRKQKFD